MKRRTKKEIQNTSVVQSYQSPRFKREIQTSLPVEKLKNFDLNLTKAGYIKILPIQFSSPWLVMGGWWEAVKPQGKLAHYLKPFWKCHVFNQANKISIQLWTTFLHFRFEIIFLIKRTINFLHLAEAFCSGVPICVFIVYTYLYLLIICTIFYLCCTVDSLLYWVLNVLFFHSSGLQTLKGGTARVVNDMTCLMWHHYHS